MRKGIIMAIMEGMILMNSVPNPESKRKALTTLTTLTTKTTPPTSTTNNSKNPLVRPPHKSSQAR